MINAWHLAASYCRPYRSIIRKIFGYRVTGYHMSRYYRKIHNYFMDELWYYFAYTIHRTIYISNIYYCTTYYCCLETFALPSSTFLATASEELPVSQRRFWESCPVYIPASTVSAPTAIHQATGTREQQSSSGPSSNQLDRQASLSILSMNIQSIHAQFQELEVFIETLQSVDFKFNIIRLKECWLSEQTECNCIQLPGYDCVTQGKTCSASG